MKKLTLLLIIALIVVLSFSVFFTGCKTQTAAATTAAAVATAAAETTASTAAYNLIEDGFLTLGVAEDPPGSMWVSDSKLTGFAGDIWTEIAKRMGLKIKASQVVWDSLVPSIVAKKVDSDAVGMWSTLERSKSVDFTIPHGYEARAIQQLKGTKYDTIDSLKGLTVASVVGNAEVPDYEAAGAKINLFKTPILAIQDVINGNSVAAVVGEILFAYETTKTPELKEKMYQLTVKGDAGGALAFAIRKDNKGLLDAVNKVMEAMWIDGTMDKIYNDWGMSDYAFRRLPGTIPWVSPSCNSYVHSQYSYNEDGSIK